MRLCGLISMGLGSVLDWHGLCHQSLALGGGHLHTHWLVQLCGL